MACLRFGEIIKLYLTLTHNVRLKENQQNRGKLYSLYSVKTGKKHTERFDCLIQIGMILFS